MRSNPVLAAALEGAMPQKPAPQQQDKVVGAADSSKQPPKQPQPQGGQQAMLKQDLHPQHPQQRHPQQQDQPPARPVVASEMPNGSPAGAFLLTLVLGGMWGGAAAARLLSCARLEEDDDV
eukprot:748892-Rhodomonas_salina.1